MKQKYIYIFLIKIQQPTSVNKEYYHNEEFINAYMGYIKNILSYLNPNFKENTNDINELIDFSHKLAMVKYIKKYNIVMAFKC